MSNIPISEVDTPDPWILPHNDLFYLTFTLGNRIEIWSSPSLEHFHSSSTPKSLIWKPRPGSPWSVDIWAPELHRLNDTWYIYTTAAQPGRGNASHRTLVLRSEDMDPMNEAAWKFLGPIKGLPDHWHIDATVFYLPSPKANSGPIINLKSNSHSNCADLYICYSGWPLDDHSDTEQVLFIAELSSPTSAIPSTVTTISRPTLPWERPDSGRRGINEGPTFLSLPGCFTGIVFSAHGSWTNEYKLGLLQLMGSDPLNPDCWKKRSTPLMQSDVSLGVGPYGPGHASFVRSPYGDDEVYCVYHGTENVGDGWGNRKARVVKLTRDHFGESSLTICAARAAEGGSGGVLGWFYPNRTTDGPVVEKRSEVKDENGPVMANQAETKLGKGENGNGNGQERDASRKAKEVGMEKEATGGKVTKGIMQRLKEQLDRTVQKSSER